MVKRGKGAARSCGIACGGGSGNSEVAIWPSVSFFAPERRVISHCVKAGQNELQHRRPFVTGARISRVHVGRSVRRTCLWCRPRRPVRVIARALSTWLADSKLDMAWRQTCGHYRRGNRIWRREHGWGISGEKTINELATEADDVQTMAMRVFGVESRWPESWHKSAPQLDQPHAPTSMTDCRRQLASICNSIGPVILISFSSSLTRARLNSLFTLSTAHGADPRVETQRSDWIMIMDLV